MLRSLSDWPLLICGPMLRRVDATHVCVFVALKEPCRVTLTVLRGAADAVAVGEADTVPLGSALHVVVVVAEPPSGEPLEHGRNYSYDVEFETETGTETEPGERKSLKSLGLLTAPLLLGYAPNVLPSFALPPAELARLRILHGSCRKPHGEDLDMLAFADELIEASRSDPLARPHQLLLTGDQIYADDVALVLARAATKAAALLIGGATTGAADEFERLFGHRPHDVLAGPVREQFIAARSGFTTEARRGHLIFLAEFYAMYLLAWSDELWLRDAADPPLPLGSGLTSDSLLGELTAPEIPETMRTQAREELEWVRNFAASSRRVRRALANVPTAMIYDDHEVTDDWNLNQGWVDGAHALDAAGGRVVRNALAAYALFQHWGNAPELFAAGASGATLLDAVRGGVSGGKFVSALSTAPGLLDGVLGLPPGATAAERMRWHFDLRGPAHQIVFLDTRTHRDFASSVESAALLSEQALEEQLASVAPGLATIIVSPAPVFGVKLIELVQDASAAQGSPEKHDAESWSGNAAAMERLVLRLAGIGRVVLLSGDVHYGYSNEVTMLRPGATPLLARAAQFCCSSLKNEDSTTRLAGLLGTPAIGGVFAGAEALGSAAPLEGLRLKLLELAKQARDGGESAAPFEVEEFALRVSSHLGGHFVFPWQAWTSESWAGAREALTGAAVALRYVVRFLSDDRSADARERSHHGGEQGFAQMRRLRALDASRILVGFANVGEVQFRTSSAGTATAAIHRLHWRGLAVNAGERNFVTEHEASLEPPTQAELSL